MHDIDITFPGGKRVDAEYGGFIIKTDQPPQSSAPSLKAILGHIFRRLIRNGAVHHPTGFSRSRLSGCGPGGAVSRTSI